MILSPSQLPLRGRLSIVALLLIGTGLSLAGFFFTRNAYHRRVEVQFYADARDRAESVVQGFQRGFDDVAILGTYFESSGDVTRADFDEFTVSILARHPYIQAFQWLPEVTPRNRAALEEAARSTYPGFRFFKRDAAGKHVAMPQGAAFHAVYYLAPYKGNEVILGFATDLPRLPRAVPTARQEALARALRTGAMTASGRIRLIQETGNQFGMLVMVPIKVGEHHPKGLAQGVFRMGDLVHKSVAFLEPRGLALKLFDASATEREALLHEEPSPLLAVGPDRKDGLSLVRHFELAGRRWRMEMAPVGGHYALGAVWQAWAVLLMGLAFSGLLSRFV